MTKSEVVDIQTKLVAQGHKLVIDGIMGPKTRRAMELSASSTITLSQLTAFTPKASIAILNAIVAGSNELIAAGITTKTRKVGFLSNIATETGGLRLLVENMNYSASRLLVVFPKYYKTAALARAEANKPEAIANRVYGGRLGNTAPGDGWRYRGRGMMQTTGRTNYRKAGYEDNPEALANPAVALSSAITYWRDNGCNAVADTGNIRALRRIINGGTSGLTEVTNYAARAARIF